MKTLFSSLVCLIILSGTRVSGEKDQSTSAIKTTIDSTVTGELMMIQEFTVNVSVDSAWHAYTTKQGWEGWAVPLAEVDFRTGGTIKTNYNPGGKIGDGSSITLHIINFIPEKLLTLQAEITSNFPEFMKEDEKNLFNIILFERITDNRTKITSYGLGYKNSSKYLSMLQFFVSANKSTTEKLINYLDNGITIKK